MEWIEAKSILTKVKYGHEWYGIDYNMNLYRGCPHKCIYCDSRSSCYQIDHFDTVRGKTNALSLLEKELAKKRFKGVVGIGAMSDPYNPLELQYEQTRGALKLIAKYGFGVSIDTKSDLVLRDLDLLQEIQKHNDVIVKFTITTPSDELSKLIEPNVCVSSKRLEALKRCSDHGIFAGIMMNPVLPFITDDERDIKELIRSAGEYGAEFIHTYMGMTLRDRQRDYYFEQLDRHFTGIKEKYIKYYGNRYYCKILHYKRIEQVFRDECDRYGICYRMKDIIEAYKKGIKANEQLSLF